MGLLGAVKAGEVEDDLVVADNDLMRTGVRGGKGVLEDGLVVFRLHGGVEEEIIRGRAGKKSERNWSGEEEGPKQERVR